MASLCGFMRTAANKLFNFCHVFFCEVLSATVFSMQMSSKILHNYNSKNPKGDQITPLGFLFLSLVYFCLISATFFSCEVLPTKNLTQANRSKILHNYNSKNLLTYSNPFLNFARLHTYLFLLKILHEIFCEVLSATVFSMQMSSKILHNYNSKNPKSEIK